MPSSYSHANEESLSIRGVLPGMSQTEVIEKLPQLKCGSTPGGPLGDATCYANQDPTKLNEHLIYGGARAKSIQLHFLDGGVGDAIVFINESDFSSVAESLKIKFGQPSTTTEKAVQNQAGASFTSQEFKWTNGETTLTATQRWGSVSESRIRLTTQSADKEFQRRFSERAKKNASTL